ncbi:hypothetical protein E2C01_024112 [Portunus trituberculatus]|uniref:Uncharacterized protein n=1 Tax=Portunus trituberculatus TaxID=210409 RepID=A0A5B7E9T4_PORTR|nr:hypothetical protein [Portunus trituberculatus]
MWLEILAALVVVVMSVRFWYRYTSGHCTSTRSMAGKTVIITGATAGEARTHYRAGRWRVTDPLRDVICSAVLFLDTHTHTHTSANVCTNCHQELGRRLLVTCSDVVPESSSPAGTWRKDAKWQVK